jgi:hypothetical protein
MEKLVGINTEVGILTGRDARFLEKIVFDKETEVTLTGEFDMITRDLNFEMNFQRNHLFFLH